MQPHGTDCDCAAKADGTVPACSCKLGFSRGTMSALWMCGQRANLLWLTCQVCPKPAVLLILSTPSAAVLWQVLICWETHHAGATNCPFSDSKPEAFRQHIDWIQQQQGDHSPSRLPGMCLDDEQGA